MNSLSRLQEIAAQRRALDAEEARLIDSLLAEAGAPQTEGLVSIDEAAARMGLTYDAARQRARRAGELRRFGSRSYVRAEWVEAQNVRHVRSVAEQRSSVVPFSRKEMNR